MSFIGKTALLTGSSHGTGRGIAPKLAEQGARIAIQYNQHRARATETLTQVRGHGADGFIVQADMAQPADLRHLFRTVEAEWRTLDIFVHSFAQNLKYNNQPQAPPASEPTLERALALWNGVVDAQVKTFLRAAHEAIRLMPEEGRMLAIIPPWVAMDAAHAALASLLRYVAVALANRAITVNAICPGWTEETLLPGLPPAGEVAALLCTEEAGWITGQVIRLDSETSLLRPQDLPAKP